MNNFYDIITIMATFRRYFSNRNEYVFVTFITYNRREILIPNINLFKDSIKYTKTKFLFDIFAITVMKDHCHLIINTDKSQEVPLIIKSLKYYFSSNIPEEYIYKNLSESAKKRNEKGIWQRRYYDHIIRDEEDLYRHVDYIHYNSVKHHNILPKDWKYSSFINFVKKDFYDINWCNFNDEYKIKELNFE